mgnify:CR=1 FL=1|tara:strand:- start:159 stop:1355 length:1197 start_codon:yes stop_codon:yes gene_type:complete
MKVQTVNGSAKNNLCDDDLQTLFSDKNMIARFQSSQSLHKSAKSQNTYVRDNNDHIVGFMAIYELDVASQTQTPMKNLFPVEKCLWLDYLGVDSAHRKENVFTKYMLPVIDSVHQSYLQDEKTTLPCFTVCRLDNRAALVALQKSFVFLASFKNKLGTTYVFCGPPLGVQRHPNFGQSVRSAEQHSIDFEPVLANPSIAYDNRFQNFLLSKSQLEKTSNVVQRFVEFCHTRCIPYVASSGTALGALRHGGPIPWDDDVDFGIFFSTDRFLRKKCFAKDLLERYNIEFVPHPSSNPWLLLKDESVHVDVFVAWIRADSVAVPGFSKNHFLRKCDIKDLIDPQVALFEKIQIYVPGHANSVLEHTYGSDWSQKLLVKYPHSHPRNGIAFRAKVEDFFEKK